ncbi:hypothetical protein ACFQ78_37580 [Streptomyces sp. NPDC056519]|uniref:hypothetical protein n=1 Tax=Streptomyces sp. NPDC056519 TaxID=3345849 RepID=UPI0036A4B4BF
MVRLTRTDPVGGDHGVVDDDEVALTQTNDSLVRARCPRREDRQGLVGVSPSRRLENPETGFELGKRLVLAQVIVHAGISALQKRIPGSGRTRTSLP